MLEAAHQELNGLLELSPADAGMHLVGWLPRDLSDQDAASAAITQGVETIPLSSYTMAPLSRGALLLGYADFEIAAIRTGAKRLAVALRQVQKQNTNAVRGQRR